MELRFKLDCTRNKRSFILSRSSCNGYKPRGLIEALVRKQAATSNHLSTFAVLWGFCPTVLENSTSAGWLSKSCCKSARSEAIQQTTIVTQAHLSAWGTTVKEVFRLSPQSKWNFASRTIPSHPVFLYSDSALLLAGLKMFVTAHRSTRLMFLLSFYLQTSHLLAYVIWHWVLGCSLGSHTALYVSESDIQSV